MKKFLIIPLILLVAVIQINAVEYGADDSDSQEVENRREMAKQRARAGASENRREQKRAAAANNAQNRREQKRSEAEQRREGLININSLPANVAQALKVRPENLGRSDRERAAQILGVPANVSSLELKNAFSKLMAQWSDERNQDKLELAKAVRNALRNAYAILEH